MDTGCPFQVVPSADQSISHSPGSEEDGPEIGAVGRVESAMPQRRWLGNFNSE
jgi:hypothetical protein